MSSINKLKTIMVTLLTCAAFSAGAATQAEEPSGSPLCSDTLNSAMDFLSTIPLVGDGASTLAKTVQTASCPSSSDQLKDYMANQFAKINVELTNINNKLTDLSNQMNAMNQNINYKALKAQQTKVDEYDSEFDSWLGQYQLALATFKGKDGKEYNSLTDLVNSYGTFDKAISSLPSLKGVLDQLYNTDSELTAISNLKTPARFDLDAIVGLCKDSSTIAGDVFSLRNICNTTTVAMYAKNIMLEKQVEYAYNDISKVYNIDTRKDKVTLYQINKSLFTGWVDSAEQMNPRKAIISQIESTEAIYPLAKNLEAKGFKLTGWFTAPDKRYLTVEYTMGANVIKSKYAYQQPTRKTNSMEYGTNTIDDKITNVMGVPVPERFFTAGGADYRDNNAFPWADISHIGGAISTYVPTKLIVPASGNVAINAFGFSPEKIYYKDKMISPNFGYIENQRKIFVSSPTEANTYLLQYDLKDYDRIGKGDFFTFMRYTAQDGYTYVWTMRTWIEEGGFNDSLNLYWFGRPQCMTNDCLVINTGAKLESLKFQGGPTIEWSYVTPYNNYTLKAN